MDGFIPSLGKGKQLIPWLQAGLKEPVVNVSQVAPHLLRTLFLHHDGIVLGAIIAALHKRGLLNWLWGKRSVCMREILDRFPANDGYLHVALRALALQGWLNRHGPPASLDLAFEVTKTGEIVAETFATYAEVGEFVYSDVPMDDILFAGGKADYAHMIDRCRQGWGLPTEHTDAHRQALFATIRQQLDGLVVGPLMVAFKRRGLLGGDDFPLVNFPAENLQWQISGVSLPPPAFSTLHFVLKILARAHNLTSTTHLN